MKTGIQDLLQKTIQTIQATLDINDPGYKIFYAVKDGSVIIVDNHFNPALLIKQDGTFSYYSPRVPAPHPAPIPGVADPAAASNIKSDPVSADSAFDRAMKGL